MPGRKNERSIKGKHCANPPSTVLCLQSFLNLDAELDMMGSCGGFYCGGCGGCGCCGGFVVMYGSYLGPDTRFFR